MMDNDFLKYNALDSACMMQIHDAIWPDLSEGFQKTYDMTIRLMPVVMFMQARGMKVDHKLLGETKTEILAKQDELQQELNKMCGRELNVNSSKDCCAYFYVEKGLPVITGKGKQTASVDDAALQRMIRGTARNPSVPEARLVQEIRGLKKLYNTYLNAVFDEDGRLRGAYNLRGTKFGRLSSSKTIAGTGLNYQNIPQEFKKFLVADDGYVLAEFDKRQAEWVVVAYASGDPNMIQAIENHVDVHAHTASLMFDLPIDIVKYEHNLVGHTSNADEIHEIRSRDEVLSKIYNASWPRTMSLRQCGKKSNHGLNYDEGPNNFALINEMSIPEAKRVIQLYHTSYRSIRQWHSWVQSQLRGTRTLTNCFGRKVYFMGDLCQGMMKAGYAMIPQSTVVDSVNFGMAKCYGDALLVKDFNIDILAQVHDSILFQIPIEVVRNETRMQIVKRKIEEYMSPTLSYSGRDFKIATDCKVGKNWGEVRGDTNKTGMRDYEKYEDMVGLLMEIGVCEN